MEEQRRRWAAEQELKEERQAARAAAGLERRSTAHADVQLRAAEAALAVAESTVRSEQALRGHAVLRAETAEAMLDKQAAIGTTLRLQERRDAGKAAELNAAREVTGELRARLQEVEAELPFELRQVTGRQAGTMDEDTTKEAPLNLTITLISPRVNGTNNFSPRELEFIRRIIDECGMSFSRRTPRPTRSSRRSCWVSS